MSGYNFKRNSCNIPSGYSLNSGKRMCRKLTPRYPNWYNSNVKTSAGLPCASISVTYPNAARDTYTIPKGEAGAYASDTKYDLPNATTCSVSAVCEAGRWVPEEGQSNIVTCSDLKVAMQMDWAPGTGFTGDRKVCVLEVPRGAVSDTSRSRSFYTRFNGSCSTLGDSKQHACVQHWPPGDNALCSGPGCVDSRSDNKTCNGKKRKYDGNFCHEYPTDALDNGVVNALSVHTYFVPYNNATDGSLRFCETPETDGISD